MRSRVLYILLIFQDKILTNATSGTNHFKLRRKFLLASVKEQCDGMFGVGYEKMHMKYEMNVKKLPQAFSEMVRFAGTKVMTQISLLMDRLGGASGQGW